MNGWIILDKPVGLGSTQAVGAVKRVCREAGLGKVKVGHGGTLDPLASGVLPIPPRLDPIALQLSGWDALASQVEAARVQASAGYVAADQYALAAELAFGLPGSAPVVGVEQRWRLFALPAARPGEATGLLVRNVRRSDPVDPAVWRDAVPVGEVARGPVERFRLYRVTLAPSASDAVRLPRPAPAGGG